MKPRITIAISIVLVCLLVGFFTIVSTNPRRVIVTDGGQVVPDVTVKILDGTATGGWNESITNQAGIAEFGTGRWNDSWEKKPMILAVFQSDEILWEGVVRPEILDDVEIPISRKNQESQQDVTPNH
jgi:hypothetical protein